MTTNFNVKCINFMCSCIPTQLLVSCAVLKMLLLLLLFCFGGFCYVNTPCCIYAGDYNPWVYPISKSSSVIKYV